MQKIEIRVIKTYFDKQAPKCLFAKMVELSNDCTFDYQSIVTALSLLYRDDPNVHIEFSRYLSNK